MDSKNKLLGNKKFIFLFVFLFAILLSVSLINSAEYENPVTDGHGRTDTTGSTVSTAQGYVIKIMETISDKLLVSVETYNLTTATRCLLYDLGTDNPTGSVNGTLIATANITNHIANFSDTLPNLNNSKYYAVVCDANGGSYTRRYDNPAGSCPYGGNNIRYIERVSEVGLPILGGFDACHVYNIKEITTASPPTEPYVNTTTDAHDCTLSLSGSVTYPQGTTFIANENKSLISIQTHTSFTGTHCFVGSIAGSCTAGGEVVPLANATIVGDIANFSLGAVNLTRDNCYIATCGQYGTYTRRHTTTCSPVNRTNVLFQHRALQTTNLSYWAGGGGNMYNLLSITTADLTVPVIPLFENPVYDTHGYSQTTTSGATTLQGYVINVINGTSKVLISATLKAGVTADTCYLADLGTSDPTSLVQGTHIASANVTEYVADFSEALPELNSSKYYAVVCGNANRSSYTRWYSTGSCDTAGTNINWKERVSESGVGAYPNVSGFDACHHYNVEGITTADLIVPEVDDSPNSSLIYPLDSAENNTGVTINFNCSATDDNNLANTSLYIWNSTGSNIHTNLTTIVGTNNSTIFAYSFSNEDLFTWNCLAYDNASQSDWGINRTINISEIILPEVSLITPTNNSNYVVSNITFNCSATAVDGILNMSLYFNGIRNITITNTTATQLNMTLATNLTLSNGDYNYTCDVYDTDDEQGINSTRFFSITPPYNNTFLDSHGASMPTIQSISYPRGIAVISNANRTLISFKAVSGQNTPRCYVHTTDDCVGDNTPTTAVMIANVSMVSDVANFTAGSVNLTKGQCYIFSCGGETYSASSSHSKGTQVFPNNDTYIQWNWRAYFNNNLTTWSGAGGRNNVLNIQSVLTADLILPPAEEEEEEVQSFFTNSTNSSIPSFDYLNDHMVAYYNFDTGSELEDIKHGIYNLSVVNGVGNGGNTSQSVIGQSLFCGGVQGNANVYNVSNQNVGSVWNIGTEGTVQFWYREYLAYDRYSNIWSHYDAGTNRFRFFFTNNPKTTIISNLGLTDPQAGAPASGGAWHLITGTWNTTSVDLFIDDARYGTDVGNIVLDMSSLANSIDICGTNQDNTVTYSNMDEMMILNVSLNSSQIAKIYNEGGITYTPLPFTGDSPPTSSLVSPLNNANFTPSTEVTFNCSATDDNNLANTTLYIWNSTGSNIHTNFSTLTGLNDSTTFVYNLTTEDLYQWNCLVYDNGTQSDWAGNRTLNISALIEPNVDPVINEHNQNYTYHWINNTHTLYLNITNCSDDNGDPLTYNWTVDGFLNYTGNNYPFIGSAHGIGIYEVTGYCNDDTGLSDSVSFNVEVINSSSFILVVYPDTQLYSRDTGGATIEMFYNMTEWTKQSFTKSNMEFVMHVGDLVDSPNTEQFGKASDSMDILDDGIVQYGTAIGNHDYNTKATRVSTLYNTYFGSARYTGASGFQGSFSGFDNTYFFINHSGINFTVINFEMCPRNATIEWARGIIHDNPDRIVIINQQSFLNTTGGYSIDDQISSCDDYFNEENNGQELWDYFISQTNNIMFMVNGHLAPHSYKNDTAQNNLVHMYMTNYQGFLNGGEGYLNLFIVDTVNREITKEAYSPYLDEMNHSAPQEFTVENATLYTTYFEELPTSTLISPVDNRANYVPKEITFNCSVTDANYNLDNVTLYIWNSSNDVHHTNTSSITGEINSTTFVYNFTTTDTYHWNCLVYDNSSNGVWATANRSIELISIVDSNWTYELLKGLVAYYDFETGEGTTLVDTVGGVYNGTFVGVPSWIYSGKIGNSILFDGGDAVDFGVIFKYPNYTWNLWVNSSDMTTDYQALMGSDDGGYNDDVILWIPPLDNSFRTNYDSIATQYVINTSSDFDADVWYMLTLTTDSSETCFYVDTVLIGCNGTAFNLENSVKDFMMGARQGSPNRYMQDGRLDEIAIFNRSISFSEIETLFNNGDGTPLNLSVTPTTTTTISNIQYTAIDSNGTAIAGGVLGFNSSNLQDIEFMNISFTLTDTDIIVNDIGLYFTASGTKACAIGNNQSTTCYNLENGTFVEFRNGTATDTFIDYGVSAGDYVACDYVGTPTERNYTCQIDEHYNPNVYKNYPLNTSDVQYNTTEALRIKSGGLWKVDVRDIEVPIGADYYKLDFRVNATMGGDVPDQPINAWICDSDYDNLPPAGNPNCQFIASKLPSELQDDGTKFRGVFATNTSVLDDVAYVILQSFQLNLPTKYYTPKTLRFLGSDSEKRTQYSSNSGITWNNISDYESELNINWYYRLTNFTNATAFNFKVGVEDNLSNIVNTSLSTMTWILGDDNLPIITTIITPEVNQNFTQVINLNIPISWDTSDLNNDNYTTNVTFSNSTDTIIINSSLPNTINNIIWITSLYGSFNITIESCEVGTLELYCDNDTHQILILQEVTNPIIELSTPENNTYSNATTVNFTVNVSDDFGIDNITLTIYNETDLYNQTTITLGGVLTVVVGLPVILAEGIYQWFWSVIDSANNELVDSNQTLEIDLTDPTITIVSPVNGTNYYSNSVDFNWLTLEPNLEYCAYGIDVAPNETGIYPTLTNFVEQPDANVTYEIAINSNPANIVDNNWASSGGHVGAGIGYHYFNYTKPEGVGYGTMLEGKTNGVHANVTVPQDCWDAYSDTLVFLGRSTGDTQIADYQCYNGTDWKVIINVALDWLLTEYSVWWNYPVPPVKINVTLSGLSHGEHNLTVYCNDSATNEYEETVYFFNDLYAPNLTIDYPQNISYNSQITQFNYTTSDENLDECWYTTDNGATNNTTVTCNLPININSTEGSNTWIIYVKDEGNQTSNDSVTFIMDILPPTITITSPSNNSYKSGTSFTVVVDAYDSTENEIIFRLYNGTALESSVARVQNPYYMDIGGTTTPADVSALNDSDQSTYFNSTFFGFCSGSYPNHPKVDIEFDNLTYQLTTDEPTNLDWRLNITVVDWSNGTSPFSLYYDGVYTQCWDWSGQSWVNFGNGHLHYSVGWGNQLWQQNDIPLTCVNENFLVSVKLPRIYSGCGTDVLWYETWLEYDGNTKVPMQSGSYTDKTRSHPFTGLDDGSYFFDVYINDDYGRSNETGLYKITLDNVDPEGESGGYSGSGTSPANGSAFNTPSVNLTLNASDDGGIKNITLVIKNESGDIINQTEIDIFGDFGYSPTEIIFGIVYYFVYEGWYSWYYKITDMVGNIFTTTEATMLYDITCPNCSIIYYPLNTSYDDNITAFNYTLLEENPSTCWFSVDGGVTNNTVTCGQNLTSLTSVEGVNYWQFWVNDTATNEHTCNVTFTIDTVAPKIYMHSPVNGGVYNTSEILLNVTTSESYIWWSIDNGTTNTTYLTPTLIDFIGGDNVLFVWANDTAGNLNVSIIYFNTDAFNPLVDLYPVNDTGANSYPHYINVTYVVVDDNPDVCWYSYGNNWSTEEFAYYSTSENMTFSAGENITRLLKVPDGTTLTNATLTLTGFDAESVDSFENTTDGWNLCGGGARINNSWASRGDWNMRLDSFGATHEAYKLVNLSDYDYLIFDYNRSAQNKSIRWGYCENIVSCGGLHSSCSYWGSEGYLNENGEHLDNVIDVSADTGMKYLFLSNFFQGVGGTYDYIQIDNIRLSSINSTSFPTNASLEIGTTDGNYEWNQTGEFNESNSPVIIGDVADEINTYLETCTLVNGSCYVPFVFHSDTSGFLRYEDMQYINYDIISCNSSETVQVYDEGDLTLTVCAEDLVGLTGCDSEDFYNMLHEYNQTVDNNQTVEGNVNVFTLEIEVTDASLSEINAWLVYNGVNYSALDDGTETLIGNNFTFEKQFTIPDGSGNLTGKNASWYWSYEIEGYVDEFNTTPVGQTVYALDIDNCTNQTTVILNLTLQDEETATTLSSNISSTIELELAIISKLDEEAQWVHDDTAEKNLLVCIPSGLLNFSEYRIDFTVGFEGTDYVKEFYYMENGTLDNTENFNSYTTHTINLYDLLSADSTTFLFEFTNTDGLPVDDGIVHTYRKYIGEGIFREVERSKQDDNGETHLHLVEEDEIYYFVITIDGEIIYTSSTYNAKCLSLPCTIQLDARPEGLEFATDWDNFEGGSFAITSNKDTRIVSLSFASENVSEMNLTVWRYEQETATGGYVEVPISSSSITATSGTAQVEVPAIYVDSQLFASVHKDGTHIDSDWVSLRAEGKEVFGVFGVLLTALLIIVLVLMTATEGVAMIIFLLLGLAISSIMAIMDMSWLAFISITIAGVILIIKLTNRRRVQ